MRKISLIEFEAGKECGPQETESVREKEEMENW